MIGKKEKMNINGKTKVMGLIGHPVEHTLSPLIHNTIASHMGENMIYVPFPASGDMEAVIKGAYALGIAGMNVTVPYKSAVMPYLERVDEQAKIIGAVNTLVRTQKGFAGYNTDLPGLKRAMESDGIGIKGQKILVIGAGGAARAAAFMGAFYGAGSIVILNRTPEKARHIADEIKEKTGFADIEAFSLEGYDAVKGDGYLVLQATKAGLFPNTEDSPITDPAFFKKASVVYDLIYTPRETKFMRLAGQCGVPAYNGMKMLLYQAAAAYEMWNHVVLPEEAVKKAYEKLSESI